MRILLSIFGLVIAGVAVGAPSFSPLRQSQQFTVVDTRSVQQYLPGRLHSASGEDLIKLDADGLLLTAERVKEALLVELNYSSGAPGRIRLILYPALKPDHLIRVISNYSPGEWEYRVEIPDQIEATKLVRGLIHVLLLEIANRGQGPKSAELPLWLVEGLTLHLSATAQKDLVVASIPVGSMLRVIRETPKPLPGGIPFSPLDPLHYAREILRVNRPISFSELSYPPDELLSRERLPVYQCSAQLFLYELLHTRNGRANLVTLVRELPRRWNWETALLRAYPAEFSRMLDVEKKWSVDVLAFTARDPSQIWTRVVCLDRLEEILSVPAQIRVTSEMMPQRKTLTLQQVITHWTFSAQAPLLRNRLSLLDALRLHSPKELGPLIDDYRRAVAEYLQKRDAASRTPETRMQGTLSASLVAQEAIRGLEQLDKRRQALRPESSLSVVSPITH